MWHVTWQVDCIASRSRNLSKFSNIQSRQENIFFAIYFYQAWMKILHAHTEGVIWVVEWFNFWEDLTASVRTTRWDAPKFMIQLEALWKNY